MRRESWVVTEKSAPEGKCTHCHSPVGENHKPDCVACRRTVVVSVEFTYVTTVPDDWDQELIEFKLNESGSCLDNVLDELHDLSDRVGCVCSFGVGKYVREATSEDEEDNQIFARDLEG